MRAVNRAGVESGPSPVALTLADPPTDVAAHVRPDGTTLITWTPPVAGGAALAGCFVHRTDAFGGEAALRQHAYPLTQSAWIDRTPDPHGMRRRYWVVPVDALGRLGAPSPGLWTAGRP